MGLPRHQRERAGGDLAFNWPWLLQRFRRDADEDGVPVSACSAPPPQFIAALRSCLNPNSMRPSSTGSKAT